MNILRSFLPRWSILLIDVFLCFCSLTLAYLLRFNFAIPPSERVTFIYVFPFVLFSRGISFYVTGLYKNIIRYAGSRDVVQIVLLLSVVSVFFAVSNVVIYATPLKRFVVPYSIIIIECFSSAFILIAARMMYKSIYLVGAQNFEPLRNKESIIIYGANDAGLIAKRAVDRDAGTKYEVVGFLDENKNNWGKRLEGVTIYSPSKLKELLEDNRVAHLVLSTSDISYERKNEITDICLIYNSKVLNVPPINSWINGELSFKQIKKVKIEDLLERDPIVLDKDKIEAKLKNKTVLITGAAGSIGSELVRQIIPYNPEKLVLVDQAESALYDLQLEINDLSLTPYPLPLIQIYLADICNQSRMEAIFNDTHPQIVFHAAAYKHVPVMEENPVEAVNVNIIGTRVLADLSVKYGVDTFVMISTDKAINPTGVMGASKRIAEIYVQSMGMKNEELRMKNEEQKTKFITTRFGNVLGSNGSVIPRFRQQIEKGGPVTITHPEITRFFMTIPESCQLVLEAGAIGKGGEVFIFDMGKSVKVLDLAKKMIQLSGLALDKDIKIVFTGLRPGEKLYEELLHTSENTLPTHHSLIMIAKVMEYDFKTISGYIDELAGLSVTKNDMSIVTKMKQIVPEFISNNSVFAELDKK